MAIEIDSHELTIDNLCKQDAGLSNRCTPATRGPITGGPVPWTKAMKYERQYRL